MSSINKKIHLGGGKLYKKNLVVVGAYCNNYCLYGRSQNHTAEDEVIPKSPKPRSLGKMELNTPARG